jgi:hypothetical protein
LLCQPLGFFVILRDIDSLDLEDDRPRAIVAAGNHDPIVICPALHDRATLQRCVHIPADGIPGFAAELSIHQVIEIILLRRALEEKGIARFEERTRARLGISQILFLKVWKTLRFQNRYPAFVLHIAASLSFHFFYNGPRVKTSNEDLMVNVWL